jgi:hypothetical protein
MTELTFGGLGGGLVGEETVEEEVSSVFFDPPGFPAADAHNGHANRRPQPPPAAPGPAC